MKRRRFREGGGRKSTVISRPKKDTLIWGTLYVYHSLKMFDGDHFSSGTSAAFTTCNGEMAFLTAQVSVSKSD